MASRGNLGVRGILGPGSRVWSLECKEPWIHVPSFEGQGILGSKAGVRGREMSWLNSMDLA